MIVANLATYPPRLGSLMKTIERLCPQVDRINVVLNQYQEVPLAIQKNAKICAMIPEEDTKDTGKFLPDVSDASWVFLCDDDIHYPNTYVVDSIKTMTAIDEPNFVGGYHGSIYRSARLRKWSVGGLRRYLKERRRPLGAVRDRIGIHQECPLPVVVDQLGTGVMVLRAHQMPPFDYVKSAQKYIDVRMARWCFENDIVQVCLPRPRGYMSGIEHPETIYRDFTEAHHPHVTAEICQFAFRNARVGKPAIAGCKG